MTKTPSNPHGEVYAVVSLEPFSLRAEGLLNSQRPIAGTLRMILMSDGRTEQRHNAIAHELIDGAFVSVNFIHEDTKTPVHDLMDLLRIEIFKDGRRVSYVGENDGDEFALTFNGYAVRENLVREVFRPVGAGLLVVDGGGLFRLAEIVAAFQAEIAVGRVASPTLGTTQLHLAAAFVAELGVVR